MKQFKFKLDPVLRYRTYRLRTELMNLARAKQELAETQRAIQQIHERKRNVSLALDAEQSRGMAAGRYQVYKAYVDGLDTELVEKQEQQAKSAQQVSERHGLVEAERIKKESLEHLRAERKKAYLQMLERAEQKASDELVGLRFQGPRVLE
jgi:flagellar FliJ protein